MAEKATKLFKEVKSHKIFSHLLGGNWGGIVWMAEYENLADPLEKFYYRLMGDKESPKMNAEWNALIIPGTYSVNVWTPVP